MAVTQKQIAEAAGVSRGTVDRVLHGRGRVDPDVQERVRRIARELNYQPNSIGRALVKSSATKKIGIICQFCETPFIKQLLDGIERARLELDPLGMELRVERIKSYNNVERILASMNLLLSEGVEGLAVTPGSAPEIREKLNEVAESGIPVVTFNTDMAGSKRLCYVGLDNRKAGQTCAGLMASALRQRGGLVLPITGYEDHEAHVERLSAFVEMVRDRFPYLRLLPVEHCFDMDSIAEQIVLRALDEHPDLEGVYLSANGQAGVCRALRSRGMTERVCVIGYDRTDGNVGELKAGGIDFLIDQDAEKQGSLPARLLYNCLILNQPPAREFYHTDVRILTRYNV